MEVKGNFVVTNEDLLTYLPSNWSQWSRWFLDQSQIYYGELAVVLRRQEWPTHSRDDERRILDVLEEISNNNSGAPPQSSTGPNPNASAQQTALDSGSDSDDGDSTPSPDHYPWSESATLTAWYDRELPRRAAVLDQLLVHVHRIALDDKRSMRRQLPAFWQLIMSTLSDSSRKMVMADRHYEVYMDVHDVLGLWMLIKHVHTRGKGGTILQIRNAEKKFLDLRMGEHGIPTVHSEVRAVRS
jgi:hypothetical protein